ncbi:hypothetical protein L1887_48024 [Cichorium endivia]|nr:hypothetical protein L1887_48024 [Cichorium endivia]
MRYLPPTRRSMVAVAGGGDGRGGGQERCGDGTTPADQMGSEMGGQAAVGMQSRVAMTNKAGVDVVSSRVRAVCDGLDAVRIGSEARRLASETRGRAGQAKAAQAKAGQRSEANGQRGQQQTMHAELANPRRARAGSDDLTWLALRVRVKVELPIFPSPGPRPLAGFSSAAAQPQFGSFTPTEPHPHAQRSTATHSAHRSRGCP